MKFARYLMNDGTPGVRVYRNHGPTVLTPGRHILEDIGSGTVFITTLGVVEAAEEDLSPEEREMVREFNEQA